MHIVGEWVPDLMFPKEEHVGPNGVADFMDLLDEENSKKITRDAYEQV